MLEVGLDEGLHLGGVGESESGVGPQGYEHVVGVDVDLAHLGQRSRAGWRLIRRSRNNGHNGSDPGAHRRLPTAGVVGLNPACLTSSIGTTASVTGLIPNNQTVSTLRLADSVTIGLVAVLLARGTDICGGASLAGSLARDTSLGGVEVLSSGAVDRPQLKLLTDTVGILVVTLRTDTAIGDGAELGVEGTLGASSLEGELSTAAAKLANSTGAEPEASPADAPTVGDDLVESTGVAVTVSIDEFVTLALADAGGS